MLPVRLLLSSPSLEAILFSDSRELLHSPAQVRILVESGGHGPELLACRVRSRRICPRQRGVGTRIGFQSGKRGEKRSQSSLPKGVRVALEGLTV
jgi:hypothetical protein